MARALPSVDQDREHSRHFDRKIDGETRLAEQTVVVATGAHVVPRLSKITVQAFYDDWSRRQVWASGTRTAMDLAMRSSDLGRYQIGQVNHSHIEAWIKRMADQPLAPGTIRTRYNNVRGIFRAAVRDRLIVRDPTEAVRLPRQRRADASMSIATIHDVGVLLAAADDSFRAFVAPCAFAGLSLGEAASCDVVTVQRALGHGSATTTPGIYAHLWPTAEDRTRAAAADLMRSATSTENSADFLRTRTPR